MDLNFWQAILDADCAVPSGYTAAGLTPELVGYFGSTDMHLREDIGFEVLAEWLAVDANYTPAELRDLAAQMRAKLRVGLGETGTDTVFTRSVAALILGKIVDADTRREFLSAEELRGWLGQSLDYYLAERDLRGYVPVKGWAHCMAHTSDLLMSFARNPRAASPELERILDAVAARLAVPADRVWHYLEDERLSFAVMTALHRNLLGMEFLTGWLDRIAHPPGASPWRAVFADDERLYAHQNSRQFLRALYFQLTFDIRAPRWYADPAPFNAPIALRDELLPAVLAAVRAMDLGFYSVP